MTWPQTMARTVAEYLAAIALGPDENFECRACGENYDTSSDTPSTLCNTCAHEAAHLLAGELQKARASVPSEREWLEADLGQVKAFLRDMPEGRVLERMGFESRRDELEAKLAELSKVEIERKFLVHVDAFKQAEPSAWPERYDQGYLGAGVRVRVSKTKAWITIKGKADATGTTRPEYEYEIPLEDGPDLLVLCGSQVLSKNRYKVHSHGSLWDVDEFLGSLTGLWLAEVELESPDAPFAMPPWLGIEVTSDKRYTNANLARNGLLSD